MVKRLTVGFLFALAVTPILNASPNIPSEAASRIPWDRLVSAATNALCTYLGIGC
jgi:hypothetical protein